ncbi:MAG TPA: calcium-binding protein, partial [Solirubrobacterales bacterium]|nr:calcium-binding protein [Solirubrobacterales bacterium]
TQHGIFGAPVLADLDGDGRQEVIAASMDRHVYAWEASDSGPDAPGGAADAPGYPVLVVDPAKVGSVDPATHAITFAPDAGSFMQGAIIDTPAVGDITGDGRPEIVVGTNEEYDEPPNLGNPGGLALLLGAGLLDPGNSRVYALDADGDTDSDPLPDDALAPGWPFAPAMLLTETLPIVGEGVAGPPVIGPVACASGGFGSKVGVATAAGPAYIINGDGSSCHGGSGGLANALSSDFGAAATATDAPMIPALGNPAFGATYGMAGERPAFITGAIGLFKALDLQLVDYQSGQDLLGIWDPSSGAPRPGFPATVNDLQLLTGPAVAEIGGGGGEIVVTGSSSQDLAAYGAGGTPVDGWPKLTTDWTVATPLIGSLGTEDTKRSARKVVVGITRSGYVHAYRTTASSCEPASSPRFHHDNANSGDYLRDAVLPGAPTELSAKRGKLRFLAPGDDLLCGDVDHYEMATAKRPIDGASFAAAKPLRDIRYSQAPGFVQQLRVPNESKGWIAIRAVDEQGNVGRAATVKAKAKPPKPRCENRIFGATRRGDRLGGTGAGDEINGHAGNDRIDGRGGDDCASGGKGRDRIRGGKGRDRLSGGTGGDRIMAADGRRDRVRCGRGPGRDRVRADRKDRVAGDCERISRR